MAVTLVVTSTSVARRPARPTPPPDAPPTASASNPARAELTSPDRARSLTFDQPRIVVGRGAHADVRLPSRGVSDKHCVIYVEAGELALIDEGSTNGTGVNGQVLVRGRRRPLRVGDKITVPGFEIALAAAPGAPADPPERTASVARQLMIDAIAAAGAEASPPELVLKTGKRAGQRWRLPPSPAHLVAGRGDTCEILLDDPDCSRQHAEFVRDGDVVSVRDLGSKNGIMIAARRVVERRLRDGDEVQFGRTTLLFLDPTEELLRSFEGGPDDQVALQPPLPPPTPAPAPAPSPSLPRSPEGAASGASASEPTGLDGAPAPDATEGATSSSPVERNAPTIPPPSGAKGTDGRGATAPRAIRPRGRSRAADWIVITLAVIILGVSVAALYFVLRATPR